MADVKGNVQRLRRHDFTAIEAKSLKLVILATNGAKEARVYEFRAYK